MKKFLTVLLINIAFVCSVFAQVDVGIPQGKVQVIDDFENGNYWIWLETPEYEITPGKHRVVFDTSAINSDFNDVKRINVNATLLGNTKEDSSLFIDNILLIK